MLTRRSPLLVLAVALLAGCGSGGGDPADDATVPGGSGEDFAAQACDTPVPPVDLADLGAEEMREYAAAYEAAREPASQAVARDASLVRLLPAVTMAATLWENLAVLVETNGEDTTAWTPEVQGAFDRDVALLTQHVDEARTVCEGLD